MLGTPKTKEPADLFRHVLIAVFGLLAVTMYARLNTPQSSADEAIPKAILADVYVALGMKFQKIPAGTFQMGTPDHIDGRNKDELLHQVTLSRDFYMATTELTQGQWNPMMQSRPWNEYNVYGAQHLGENVAATYLTWNDAQAYCAEINRRFARHGWVFRLPTEAEWEYCCRAGSETEYSFGSEDSALGEYAWFQSNAADLNRNFSHEVAQKRANAWGLFDMHGNVYEWCHDRYGSYQTQALDPLGPSLGSRRVFRGGCWSAPADRCRAACRNATVPDQSFDELGFRLVLVPK